MYYQILIETTEKVDESDANKQYFELDRSSLDDIEANIVLPYLRKEEFVFSGKSLKFKEIKRILIKETTKTTHELSLEESSRVPHSTIRVSAIDILNYKEHVKDITTTVFNKALSVVLAKKITPPAPISVQPETPSSSHPKVLLVHGRDHFARDAVVKFLEKLGISTILIHEQIRGGKNIVEKIEENMNIGFAIILYTPTGLEPKPRAHQNIAFEHGYLIAKLGRRKVSALVKGNTETPNNIHGVIYIPMDALDSWQLAITHEMIRAGYNLDISQITFPTI
ncbi:MAG: nucleotide-binding protein [Gammaproteobacteria bacterium]|nr:nucleotide-binding protein [Gammaproteobacteria bacterium]